MTTEDRNIVAARLAGIRVAIVQPGEQDIDATHLRDEQSYPCVIVWPNGNAWYFENADTSGHMTEVPWQPDADANQAIMLADRLKVARKWRVRVAQIDARYECNIFTGDTGFYGAAAPTFAAAVVAAACAAGEATR